MLGSFLKRLDGPGGPIDDDDTKEEDAPATTTTIGSGGKVKKLRGRNQVWAAVKTEEVQDQDQDQDPENSSKSKRKSKKMSEQIVGVVYVNGDYYRMGEHKEEGGEEVCRIQFFIVDEEVRGLGVGAKLFKAAMDFVKEAGFRECRLSTSRELTAARRLYEGNGFVVVEEKHEEYTRDDNERKQIWQRMDYAWRRDESGGGADSGEEKKRTDGETEVGVGQD